MEPEWIQQQTIEQLIKSQILTSAINFEILKLSTSNVYTK
jgi:hypothetical protein